MTQSALADLRARRYIVVFSGHGSGATGDFLPDNDPPSALTIPKLGEMLRSATQKLKDKLDRPQIDVLGMDSCLMSMVEVGYEVQGLGGVHGWIGGFCTQ